MAEKLECLVIGGGVIGIAVARRLALAGLEVLVLEAEPTLAVHTSSRNSEVIHAGIYYPTDSLKARTCVAGKKQLYDYCIKRNVPFRKTGKIIVATDESQIKKLEAYKQQAEENGVHDLEFLDAAEVAKLEPKVECVAGLLSPSTGIIDSHGFVFALQGDLENAKGNIVFRSKVEHVRLDEGKILVEVGEAGSYTVECKYLVNSAGLWAQDAARKMTGLPPDCVPEQHFAKAHYYAYRGKSPFERLVYPVAGGGGLGIHATIDLAGQTRFGPDVTWVDGIDYGFDDSRKADFTAAIRRYYPGVEEDRLIAAYTGIRPKLVGSGQAPADFEIHTAGRHGIDGLVNLFGIESPGLTAALAIGDYVHNALLTSS